MVFEQKNNYINNPRITPRGPLFSTIEFNALNYCNRSCSFCPAEPQEEKYELSPPIFNKVLDELHAMEYNGIVCFSGFSEPLLNPHLETFIKDIKEKLPTAPLVINTNGDFVTQERVNLFEELGLDYLAVSIYDEATSIKINSIHSPILSSRNRYKDNAFINNRAGSLYDIDSPINAPCYYPSYLLYIDWNGDLLFCPHNYNKVGVLGNIEYDSLESVWFGEELNKRRKILSSSRDIPPCKACDVPGTVVGEKCNEAWQDRLFK